MKRKALFWKLYPLFILIALTSLIAVTIISCLSFRSFHYQQREEDLEVRATLFKKDILIYILNNDFLKVQKRATDLGRESKTRFTVILPTGKVIGDSEKSPSNMDNHKGRPEVKLALQKGKGMSVRYSHTLKKDLMYYGVSVKENDKVVGVVRASIPLSDVEEALLEIYYKVAIGFLFLLFVVAVSSWWVSKSISDPLAKMKAQAKKLAKGDFSSAVIVSPSDSQESFELGQAVNEISIQLNQKIEEITNQKNEQEAVFFSMTEGVIAVDMSERIIKLNKSACEILGITIKAHGKSVQEIIRHSELQSIILSNLTENILVAQELHLKKEDSRYIYIRSGPLLNTKKEKCGIVIVINDITKLKELERHRKEFVANVSHELRTPLTNIQGYAETLLNPSLIEEKEKLEYIKIIHNHATRLGGIIEDLLTLSKVEKETGFNEVELKLESLKPILENAIKLCEKKALKRDILINLNCSSKINLNLNLPLIEQAFLNLLDNAIKYGNNKSKIEVKCAYEKEAVVISFKDEGAGIPKENLSRIFERFYRVDKARSREVGGTGLGLSIVKHIALAHRGKVEVKSALGVGTTFSIILPA